MRVTSDAVKLVVVDEPSAAMDPEGEFELFKHLREARSGKTMIFITHRFGHLTKHADVILCVSSSALLGSCYMPRSLPVQVHEGRQLSRARYTRRASRSPRGILQPVQRTSPGIHSRWSGGDFIKSHFLGDDLGCCSVGWRQHHRSHRYQKVGCLVMCCMHASVAVGMRFKDEAKKIQMG